MLAGIEPVACIFPISAHYSGECPTIDKLRVRSLALNALLPLPPSRWGSAWY